MGGEAGHGLLVGVAVAQVEGVGAAVRPAGLGEVDVGVDEPGGDPEAGDVGGVHPGRHRAGGARAGALDLAFADDHHGVAHRGTAGAVQERRAHQRLRRRRHAGEGGEGGGDGDLPALRRLDEQALGEAGVLPAAVAHPVAVGAVDEPRADRGEVEVVGRDVIGPALPGRGGETGVAELEPFRAGARQALRVEVAREVGRAVLVTDRVQIFLEEGPRRGKIGCGVARLLAGQRGNGGGDQDRQQRSHPARAPHGADILHGVSSCRWNGGWGAYGSSLGGAVVLH